MVRFAFRRPNIASSYNQCHEKYTTEQATSVLKQPVWNSQRQQFFKWLLEKDVECPVYVFLSRCPDFFTLKIIIIIKTRTHFKTVSIKVKVIYLNSNTNSLIIKKFKKKNCVNLRLAPKAANECESKCCVSIFKYF